VSESLLDGENTAPFGLYRGRRALVMGATGFIGRWVARLLGRSGADVWLIAREPGALSSIRRPFDLRGTPVQFDVGNPDGLSTLLGSVQPDVVFNCAGYGVDRSERDAEASAAINAQFVGRLAAAVADSKETTWPGLRLVHIGSGFEYGTVTGAVDEDTPPNPQNLYEITKLDGTRALSEVCRERGLRGATARVFSAYGPGEHPARLLPSLLRAAHTGEILELTAGEQERDFTMVRDVAEGLLRLGMVPNVADGVVNLATGVQTSVRAFAETASELLGMSPDQLRFGVLPYRPGEVHQGRVSTRRVEAALGWKPSRSVSDGIAESIAFERLMDGMALR